jgi:plastocyanin
MKASNVRSGSLWMALALSAVLIGCGGDSTAPNGGGNGNGGGGNGGGGSTPVATTAVSVTTNLSFSPQHIKVARGATVTWTWAPNNDNHTVPFSSSAIASSGTQSSGTFSTTLPSTPGVYSYLCNIHGSSMSGTVTVE